MRIMKMLYFLKYYVMAHAGLKLTHAAVTAAKKKLQKKGR
jgi:hypothetical protein